ncbi:hypothetical protein [Kribbella ginsengisoli]|uniref:hypothetical protein n=1 Tax=Kribbella ginsengisoli TaxID=363865 RepID=UPI0031DA4B24
MRQGLAPDLFVWVDASDGRDSALVAADAADAADAAMVANSSVDIGVMRSQFVWTDHQK